MTEMLLYDDVNFYPCKCKTLSEQVFGIRVKAFRV